MFNSYFKPLCRDLKTFILDTLFPIHCLTCEKECPQFICGDCADKLTPLPHQFCIACQKPSVGGLTHPKCFKPHMADGLISIFDYHDEKVSKILIKGKYSFLPNVYRELGAIIAGAVKKNFPGVLDAKLAMPDLKLTPVPLHRMRQRWRGFNQSQILTESISKELNLPVVDALRRKKFTKTQKDLKKEERVKNVDSAFTLSAQFSNWKSEILNQKFLLIDDVTTTGATLKEAAQVLKRNGAAKVICLTVARD